MAISYNTIYYFCIYLLIASLFTPGFVYQYISLFLLATLYFLGDNKKILHWRYIILTLSLITLASISYTYNVLIYNVDYKTIIYWLFSYLPPLLLLGILVCSLQHIRFHRIYISYKLIVYIQSVFLIYSSYTHGVFVVGDDAVGTVGNANFMAYHIAIVLFYEINDLLWRYKKYNPKKRSMKGLEVLYLFIVFMIPESTANIGFFLMIITLTFLRAMIYNRSWKAIIGLAVFMPVVLSIFMSTYIYDRIETEVKKVSIENIEDDLIFAKIKMYLSILNGEIYSDINPLLGSGPATFTSRSSVIRMPEIRFNNPPSFIPIDTYYSDVFRKYALPLERDLRESPRGNLSTPKTSAISIAVELGMLGILLTICGFIYVVYIFIGERKNEHLSSFGIDITLLFFLDMLFLNSWEYPIYAFTYILFAVAAYKEGKVVEAIIIPSQKHNALSGMPHAQTF